MFISLPEFGSQSTIHSMKTQNPTTYLLILGFAAVVLFPLFPFPFQTINGGHPWKVEFSFFLIATIIGFVLYFKKTLLPGQLETDWGQRLIFAILLFSFLTSLRVVSWDSTVHFSTVWMGYLIAYTAARNSLHSSHLNKIPLRSLNVIGCLIAVLTVLGYLNIVTNPGFEGQFRVTFSKYSEILVILMPFFVVLSLLTRRFNFYLILSSISFLAICLSLSRTSLIAGAIGISVAIVCVLLIKREKKTWLQTAMILVVFIGLFGGSQWLGSLSGKNNSVVGRIVSTDKYQTSSNDIRYLLIGVSWEMFKDNPFLGVGGDNFGVRLNEYRSAYARKNPESPYLYAGEEILLERAHNEYLQTLAEFGVVGFSLFAAMLVFFAWQLLKTSYLAKTPSRGAYALGAFAGFAAFGVSSLASSFSFRAMQTGLVMFVLLAVGLFQLKRNTKAGAPTRLIFPLLMSIFLLFVAIKPAVAIIGSYAANEKDDKRSIEMLSKLTSMDPTNTNLLLTLAEKRIAEGDYIAAANDVKFAIREGGGAIVMYHIGARAYEKKGYLYGAISLMEECVSIYPKSAYARTYLAYLLEKQKKFDASKREFEKAVSIDTATANTWMQILKKGTLETSIEARTRKDLKKLPELRPDTVLKYEIAKQKKSE